MGYGVSWEMAVLPFVPGFKTDHIFIQIGINIQTLGESGIHGVMCNLAVISP